MSTLIGYVLGTKDDVFFVNPSYQSWDLAIDVHKATIFKDLKVANEMCKTVSRAVSSTYWDWSDIVPHPYVYELYHDGTYKEVL